MAWRRPQHPPLRRRCYRDSRQRFPIDVIFLDGDGCVVRTVSRLAPWRMAVCPRARAVVELRAGCLESLAVNAGDALYLVPTREQRRAS